MNNKTNAQFAIPDGVARMKARFLAELAGPEKNLSHAKALDATAQGCGFSNWQALSAFNKKRADEDVKVPPFMLANDREVEHDMRRARHLNQSKAIQHCLQCSREDAVQLAKLWALTLTNNSRRPRNDSPEPGSHRGSRQGSNRGARRDAGADSQHGSQPAPQQTPQQGSPRRGRNEERRTAPEQTDGEGRSARRMDSRRTSQGKGNAAGRSPVRPDPLVSGVFLSGFDEPMGHRSAQPRGSDGRGQYRQPGARSGQSMRQGTGQARRQRKPNPLMSGTFLSREERPMRQVVDREAGGYAGGQPPRSQAAVSYKKRRTIEGQ